MKSTSVFTTLVLIALGAAVGLLLPPLPTVEKQVSCTLTEVSLYVDHQSGFAKCEEGKYGQSIPIKAGVLPGAVISCTQVRDRVPYTNITVPNDTPPVKDCR